MTDQSGPVCLSGTVSTLPDVGVCMDGATHALHQAHGASVRLKGANDEVTAALNKLTDADCIVTACGRYSSSGECLLLTVSWVGPEQDFLAKVAPAQLFDGGGEFPHGNTY
jgi:hypothetical protein